MGASDETRRVQTIFKDSDPDLLIADSPATVARYGCRSFHGRDEELPATQGI